MAEATIDQSHVMREALEALSLPDVVRAAGGVVYRQDEQGRLQVVLVHRPAYDDWSLPKGKLKAGERLEAAALREVQEETGMVCLIERCLGTTRYIDRRGRDKVVWYWLMDAYEGGFTPLPEVDAVRWCDIGEAISALSYDHDRDILLRAQLAG
jgi:8-oxo-dGTP diphosphatase